MCYVMFKSFFIVCIIVLINIKISECKINKNTDLVDLTGVNFYTENNEVKIKLDVEKLLSGIFYCHIYVEVNICLYI